MGEKIVETKFMDTVYIESSQINQILISDTSDVSLGTLSAIDGLKVTKTGGLALLTNLIAGQAIKIGSEVKRVDYIETDDIFYVTRDFKDTHTTGVDVIYKDFSNNIQTTTYDGVGTVYSLENDSFENQIAISDLVGGLLALNRCVEFTNATSLFIFDDSENATERSESFITGIYNADNEDVENINNLFLAKIGRQLYFILDMVQDIITLDEDGQGTISGINPNVYNVKLNGTLIDSSEYTIDGENITVTSDRLRGSFDYITVYHFPQQADYITDNSITIRLGIYNYDNLFMLDDLLLADLDHMCWRNSFSSNIVYEFYDIDNKSTKQKDRKKVGVASSVTITTKIGSDVDDPKLIQTHLQAYIDNLDKFRTIRKVEDSGTYEYHNSARLIEGSSFEEGDVNIYTYKIDFLQRVLISPNYWGDKKWGDFFWGVDKTALE